jgi:small conductance mechanosensitive channel
MDNFFGYLKNIFFKGLFLDDFSILLSRLLNSFVVVLTYFILWKITEKILKNFLKRFNIEKTLSNFLTNLVMAIISILALITISIIFGINTASILASLGVFGLAIGFAAQDILSNIISGLFIFWDKPFVIDDLIEIKDTYGKIDKITMRTTKVVTPDGKLLTIPNKDVVNNTVASYTNFPNLRLDIDFTVDGNEDINKIRRLLFKLVEADNRFLKKPEPEVVLNKSNDYNIELIFRIWIKNEKDHIAARFDLREKLNDTLLNENVSMPYETIEVNLNN